MSVKDEKLIAGCWFCINQQLMFAEGRVVAPDPFFVSPSIICFNAPPD
ncbi:MULTISPECIES: hypothetical protein [Thermoactinomyces]|uniref:Uncharacterized protein n=1 Tax=Thermoactinomyces daqus TaxID=1329516 RepID=A0A7W1X8S5_9BACL|nr:MULTISPECIES: hypothetical protein [Thermoactinomyces]MBA4542223.1 hypothetical protein [Thermoactinomyces daqus]MBH8604449.1 hypothetical protein [Thermoactinomyces sp. CICC 10522]MBH8607551.1 hypothetical protein [Thermoactinomyces sp. CICC 10521]